MDKKLPLYQLLVSDDLTDELEVSAVALVDQPAIEKNFLAFNNAKKIQFDIVSEDRRIISGPAMLADVPIYRRDDQLGEYMVVFSSATIYEIAQKFFAKGFNQNFNLMHSEAAKVDGVNVFESFIVDTARGIQPMKGFEDAKDGSWFISAKVNNDEVWKKIKDGEVKGFSVEGMFQYKKTVSPEQAFAKLETALSDTSLSPEDALSYIKKVLEKVEL